MSLADLKSRFRDPTPAELQLLARYGELPEDARRMRAFEAFTASGLPHRRLEEWKWTDFRQALKTLEGRQQSSKPGLSPPDDAVVFRFDGAQWVAPGELPDGLKVFTKHEAQAFAGAESMPLGALTAAMTGRAGRSDLLQVEVSQPVSQPVFLDVRGNGGEFSFARIAFLVRPDADLDVIENHSGGAGLCSSMLEFGLQDGANVTRTLLQVASPEEAVAVTADVHVASSASFTQTALAFGAKVARVETRLAHTGEEARADLNAAYLAASGYHIDFTSRVRHGAPSCVTRQLTKGAVSNGGRGIFQGKFDVPRTVGQYADADMQHQALLLEDGAEVFAKPELEIYADDVECAHGNTSGQLDQAALFYMRQRGIPTAEARAMLTEAFIAEALETAHPAVREALLQASRTFLQEQS